MRLRLHSSEAVCFRLVACLLCAALCSAEVFDLDDSAPWLRSRGSVVLFDRGWDAFVVADSSCVRVSSRGVQSKPSHWTPRELPGGKWASAACAPGSGGGLCEVGVSSSCAPGFGSPLCRPWRGVVFPSSDRGVPPSFDPSSSWGGLSCSRAADGRLLVPGGGYYDLSACDVLDGGGDVVLCGRALSFARTAVADWCYWALCLIAVYAVRSLSYLVAQRVERGKSKRPLWEDAMTVVACLVALPLCLAPDGDAWFITREEAFFFAVTCSYVGLYACLFAAYAYEGGGLDPPIYNLIAATLQVIACRLYLGAETPYNPVVMWAVGTRALVKLRSPHITSLRVGLSALADSLLLSLMCVLSFEHSPHYLVAVFTLSLATSDAMSGGARTQ